MKFVIIVILAGALGFIVSVLVLIMPVKKPPFFEISIENKKEIISRLLTNRIAYLEQKEQCLQEELKRMIYQKDEQLSIPQSLIPLKIKTYEDKEIVDLESQLKSNQTLLNNTIAERNNHVFSNIDKDTTY